MPLPEKPRHAPVSRPAPQPRARLTWSRQIIDQAREQSQTPGVFNEIPNVRSMAAARARAGESFAPPVPVQKIDPPPAPAVRRQEVVFPNEPIFQPVEPTPSLTGRLHNAFQYLLQLIPRPAQISG